MRYLEYNGKKYDVGTKVKVNTSWYGEQIMVVRFGGVTGLELYNQNLSMPIRVGMASLIIEIVEPVEIQTPLPTSSSRTPPAVTDVGWVWYIIIMFGGLFFNDRWLIWIFATVYFILWINGFLNGGKK